jgi:uncharacterized protein
VSLQGEHVLLRAYLQSADRAPHTPTYERLVKAARHEALAGATVLRGTLGYGFHGLIKWSPWRIVEHVPIILEIVDTAERIASFLNGPVAQIMQNGTITLERAHVMLYRHRQHDEPCSLRLGGLLKPLSTLPQVAERPNMKVNDQGVLLRIFIGESDRYENKRLYEAIIGKVRELGLAGATVLRGTEGFGAHSVVHRASLLDMSSDLPVLVEIVDTEDQIQRLLPSLEEMVPEGMITMEHVMILLYREGSEAGSAPPSSS